MSKRRLEHSKVAEAGESACADIPSLYDDLIRKNAEDRVKTPIPDSKERFLFAATILFFQASLHYYELLGRMKKLKLYGNAADSVVPLMWQMFKRMNKRVKIGDMIVYANELRHIEKHYECTRITVTDLPTLADMVYALRTQVFLQLVQEAMKATEITNDPVELFYYVHRGMASCLSLFYYGNVMKQGFDNLVSIVGEGTTKIYMHMADA